MELLERERSIPSQPGVINVTEKRKEDRETNIIVQLHELNRDSATTLGWNDKARTLWVLSELQTKFDQESF